jgi:membrane dipeptidase
VLIIDGHLDLGHNALEWNRELRLSAHATRRLEVGMTQKGRAAGTVGLPDLCAGGVGICMATLFARVGWPHSNRDGFRSNEIASAMAWGQLAYYRELATEGAVRLITTRSALAAHASAWDADPAGEPLGFVIAMEGADPIISPDRLGNWWDAGLRVLSLCHYGASLYAHGTGMDGGLLPAGRDLLREVRTIGMVLDVSHLSEQSFYETLDSFDGPTLASHNNCRALTPGDRQLSDEMIRLLAARGGVIGSALDAWMLQPGWILGAQESNTLTLDTYVDHIDHVCQVTGDAQHAAVGSDLDGGYGIEQTPRDLDTIADLARLPAMLRARGYCDDDVALVMHGNWLRLLGEALPKA